MSNLSTSINSKSLVSQFIDKHNLLVSKIDKDKSNSGKKDGNRNLSHALNKGSFLYTTQDLNGKDNNSFYGNNSGYNDRPKFKLPTGLNIRDAKNPLPLTNITNSLFGTILRIGQEARTYFQSKLNYSTYKGMRAPLRSKTRGARVYNNSTLAIKINSKPRDYGLKLIAFI